MIAFIAYELVERLGGRVLCSGHGFMPVICFTQAPILEAIKRLETEAIAKLPEGVTPDCFIRVLCLTKTDD